MHRHQWGAVDGPVAGAGHDKGKDCGRNANAEKQGFQEKHPVAFQIVHNPYFLRVGLEGQAGRGGRRAGDDGAGGPGRGDQR